MTVNVLGTEYTIVLRTPEEDPRFAEEQLGGYVDPSTHKIVVFDYASCGAAEIEDPSYAVRHTIRHELVHAFAIESGLREECDWACDEVAIDWIAAQFPKMLECFRSAEAI